MTASPNKTQEQPFKPTAFPEGEARTGASQRRTSQVAYTHPNTKKIPSTLTPASVQPYFTSASTGANGIASGTGWAVRTAIEILPGINTPGGVISDQTVGGLTMMNSIAGLIGLHKNTQAFKGARAIDDTDGAVAAGINMAANTVQSGFGTAIIGSRSTSIAAVLAPTKTGLTAAAAFFGFLANIFVVPLFAFVGGWGAFQSHRAKKFYDNWASQGKTFEALVTSVYVPKDSIDQMIAENSISLRSSGRKALQKAVGEDAAETLSVRYYSKPLEEKKALLEKVLQKHYPELLEMKEYYFSKLDEAALDGLDLPVAIGLLLRLRKMQLKNQATAERALGADQLQKIQRAATRGLEARLVSTEVVAEAADREWTTLKAGIEASYAKTQFAYKSTALLGLFGTIVGILTLTGPIGAAVLIGLTLAWALADATHSIYTHAPTGQPGRFDKLYLGIGIALMSLSIAATVGAFLIFGGPLPIMLLSLTLAFVLLGILIHHLRRLNQQEKRWKETHTSVQDLIGDLRSREQLDSKARQLFKQLPKDARKGITDEAARARRRETRFYTTDKEKFHRAVKNSARFFWKQWWYSHKNDYFKEQAILLEQLALSIESDRAKNLTAPVEHAFGQIEDRDTLAVLFEQAHRIFAREESAHSLRYAANRFTAAQKRGREHPA